MGSRLAYLETPEGGTRSSSHRAAGLAARALTVAVPPWTSTVSISRPRRTPRRSRSPPEPRPPADAESPLHRAVLLAVFDRSPDENDEDDGQRNGENHDHHEDLGCQLHVTKSSEQALLVAVERRVAPRNRRGIDQGGRRLAVGEEAVEQRAELPDRAQVNLEEETVLARNAMAFAHLRDLQRELRDPLQLARGGLDPHDRRQLVAEGAGIDLGAVTGYDARP